MIIKEKLEKKVKDLKVIVAESKYDLLWEKYVDEHPNSTIYHTLEWLKIIEKETGQRVLKLICTDSNDNIQGLFPLQYTKGFYFRFGGIPGTKRLSSLPRTPIGGPLTSNSEITNLLINKVLEIVQTEPNYILQIKSFDKNINNEIGALHRFFWREFYIKEIPDYPNEIRYGKSKNHAKIKWAINKAQQNNVIYSIAQSENDLKKWYPLYLDIMKIHVTPARSYSFFKDLWETLRPKGLMQLVIAELEENSKKTIIAGSILFFYNKTVTHAFSGSSRDREYIELRPNDLLHWYAILDAQKNGFKYYDFGEVSKDNIGLAIYKKKWDTVKQNMYHYYYPKPAQLKEEDEFDSGTISGIKGKIWRKLPLFITAQIGKIVYKRL